MKPIRYISEETDVARAICPNENPFETLRRIGYTACDYGTPCSMFNDRDPVYFASDDVFMKFFENEYALAKDAGIFVGQVHAPSHTFASNGFTQEETNEGLCRAVVAASIMHSPYLVVHPAQPLEWADDTDPAYTKEVNFKIFSEILPTAREYGITLCLENMPAHVRHIPCSTPDEWRDYVDMMNSDSFAACFDSGHANMARNYAEMPQKYEVEDYIRIMGSRIKCVHIHDNDGNGDDHTILGTCTTGSIRWKGLIDTLVEVGYSGTYNLESFFAARLPEKVRFEAEQMQFDLFKAMLEEEGAI